MTALLRIGALILLLLSAAGIILCIAGIAALWVIRPPLTQKVDRTCARVDGALTEVGTALDTLGQLFQRAGTSLKQVRDKAPPPGSAPEKVESFRGFAAQTLLRDSVPADATPLIQKLMATTTVANSILSDLQELPPDTIPFLDKDQLSQMDDGVRKLSATTQRVADILGTPQAGVEADADAAIARIEEALDEVIKRVDEFGKKVKGIQKQAKEIQAKLDVGIFWGAVGGTILLAWFTIAQMSLFAHAWSWLRRPAGG
ncbi:MAG TPA: hypothetical protein VMS17_03520 [Gemmataceae bacterium]|nr:hypothetical protein [Gemmataceae bacterium]